MNVRFLFSTLAIFISTLSFGQDPALDSTLEYSYDCYNLYKFDEGIEVAEKAQKVAEESDNSKAYLRASFYKEISVQVKSGNQYNIHITDSLRLELLKNNLLRDAARAHLHLARTYYYFGDVQKEVSQYSKALELYEQLNHEPGIASVYSDMSLMYYDQHDYEPAFENIRKAIRIDEKLNDPGVMHRDYNNLAIIYEHTGPIDSAIYFHTIAVDFAYKAKDPYSLGISLSNLGNNYVMAGMLDLAEDTLLKALKIRTSVGNLRGLAFTNIRLSYLYIEKGNLKKAKLHAQNSMNYANQLSDLKVKRMAYDKFLEIAELENNSAEALKYLKLVRHLEDSLHNSDNTKEITKTIMRYEFAKQEFADSIANNTKELKLKTEYDTQILREKYIRNVSFAIGLILFILAVGLYYRFRFIKKAKAELLIEKNRSDELLLNILPPEVAEELKTKGKSEARDFDDVTVLFTDFVQFTEQAEKLSAKELVNEINACFEEFDSIITTYKLEKIKTIGDAYMAAGGLHMPRTSEPHDVIKAAIEMQKFMLSRKAKRIEQNLPAFQMRVGIHTGPVVAGIVGVKKFQYDIWGDTVNTASRMESSGKVGKVNISQATYELLKDDRDFTFESRGKIEAKGKGAIEMYFVSV